MKRELDPYTLKWAASRLLAQVRGIVDQLDCARQDGNEWEEARYEGKIDALTDAAAAFRRRATPRKPATKAKRQAK